LILSHKFFKKMERKIDKRGQIAIFVVVAVVIVGVIVAIFLFPQINVFAGEVDPSSYLKDCMEQDTTETMELLASQGGYLNPENYVLYQDNKFTYLCYSSENYKTCTVQQPLIKANFEKELKAQIEPRARQCVRDLEEQYKKRGYEVESSSGELNVSFVPGRLVLSFLSPMTIRKEGVQTFRQFTTSLDTEMYDLLMTASSIIDFESTLGDTDTLLYIQYYPDLTIDKLKRDGDTLYILGNVLTEEEFKFASRSLVWPPGYGLEEI